MLLQKEQTTPYTRVFKLVTGEEIIATVQSESSDEYIIDKPLQMAMGQRGPQFAPFLMLANPDNHVSIRKDKVVASAAPVEGIEGQYKSITTGIALPQKSSILAV